MQNTNDWTLVTDSPLVNLKSSVTDLYWKNQNKWFQTTCIIISGSQIVPLISDQKEVSAVWVQGNISCLEVR